MRSKNLKQEPINSGSMADIAFLLLIFFLVSTTLAQEKGLSLLLPPKTEEKIDVPIHERNLYKILINSQNQFLVNGEPKTSLEGVKDEIRKFVTNNGADPNLSINPEKAIVSIKANRGTEYKYFVEVLDEAKAAYYEIYADRVGLTDEQYLALNHDDPVEYDRYLKGKEGIPMNISIAQPD
jgi:biopolymer transport protein ExbD